MGDSRKVSALSGTLATVAIASLSGPVPAFGAALGQVVKFAQSRYLAGADSRDLQRSVEETIKAWAQSEHINDDDRRLGLTLACQVIGNHGASWETIAELDFDAKLVCSAVLALARAANSRWGEEPHYGVAERAIAQTYEVLIRDVRAKQGPLLHAVQAARAQITDALDTVTAMGQQQAVTLGQLQMALIAGATEADVMVYLRARIQDWDRSDWLATDRKPSRLERQLRGRDGESEMSADEALDGQRRLVVLGQPGSGKTWLARRYARVSAQAALVALEAGADLLSVEIPVYTTWDAWTKEGGEVRSALVAASFSFGSGHSDLGGGEIVERLVRTFTAEGRKILAIVDSLDEAAADTTQTTRVAELESVTGWRFVVTSRPSAWHATTGTRTLADWRVMALLDLDPHAVTGFVDEWFADDPARSAALTTQIAERAQLQQISVIPLLLTFLCLLTESADDPYLPLPAARRALYQQILERLVHSAWANTSPGEQSQLETKDCLDLLTKWAWQAVKDSNTPAGLGNWADTFTPTAIPRQFSEYERRALDNIAPRTGNGKRRFIHRTVLEHLVAQHISSQTTEEAANLLLPHVWFDTDWEWVVPAAIAYHNHEHPGELFESVMASISYPHSDPARTFAYTSVIELLLRVIVESDPQDWPAADAEWLGGLRSKWVPAYPGLVARSAHWTASNSAVIDGAARLLLEGDSRDELLTLLLVCAQTVPERNRARESVLTRLWSATPEDTSTLAIVLSRLCRNAEERAAVRSGLLHLLEGSGRDDQVSFLASSLLSLDPDPDQANRAFNRLLNAFFRVDLRWFTRHVACLKDYLPLADGGPHRSHEFLMSDPVSLEAVHFARLLIAFPMLEPLHADRSKLRDAAMRRYRIDGDAALVYLIYLPLLEPSASQKQEVRSWLVERASTCNIRSMPPLLSAFLLLDPSDDERATLWRVISGLVASVEPRHAPDFVAGALMLGVPAADRTELLTSLVRALTCTDIHPEAISTIIEGVRGAGAQQAELRRIVLSVVPESDEFGLARLWILMLTLDPTPEDLAALRAEATARVGTTEKSTKALSGPNATAGLMKDRLASVGSSDLALMLSLVGATDFDDWQMGSVRQSILDVLNEGDSPSLPFLVPQLRNFSTFDEWLQWLSEVS